MMRAAILLAALAFSAQGQTVAGGQPIKLVAWQHVWFGTPGAWVSKYIQSDGTYQCANATFGKDPAPGRIKECRVSAFSAAPACHPSTVGGSGGPVRVSIGITLTGVNAYMGWTCPAGAVAYVCSGMGCINGLLVPPEDASVSAMHAAAIRQIEATK